MAARRGRAAAGARLALCAASLALIAPLVPRPVAAQPDGDRQPGLPFSHPSDTLLRWTVLVVPAGASLEGLFGSHWPIVARFNRIDRLHVRPGVRLKVPESLHDATDFTPLPRHYAPADTVAKFILVDLSEQFLGVYDHGRLVMSFPVTTGAVRGSTPVGDFQVDAADPDHHSSLYCMSDGLTPYPMHSGLRFHVSENGEAYWIHGRDMPGRPASHGCIGLYDESMQNLHYGVPERPVLLDALRLFEWAVGPWPAERGERLVRGGPRVRIVGESARDTTRPIEP